MFALGDKNEGNMKLLLNAADGALLVRLLHNKHGLVVPQLENIGVFHPLSGEAAHGLVVLPDGWAEVGVVCLRALEILQNLKYCRPCRLLGHGKAAVLQQLSLPQHLSDLVVHGQHGVRSRRTDKIKAAVPLLVKKYDSQGRGCLSCPRQGRHVNPVFLQLSFDKAAEHVLPDCTDKGGGCAQLASLGKHVARSPSRRSHHAQLSLRGIDAGKID